MDWSLITTLLIIFLVTLVGGYLRSRAKDPCLEAFDGYPVTVERANGKVIWGTSQLWPTGMEIIYTDNVQDENHIESSYLLYAAEYPDIQSIYRYADKLTPEKRARRNIDIERSFHPNRWRRGWRGFRNFMGTASTSLTEAFSVLIGRIRKPAGAYISDKGEAYLTKLGGSLIGQVGAVYDQMLERHIGQKVVIEVVEGDQVHEHVGIFKNYSADFVEVLDVHYPDKRSLSLSAESGSENEAVTVHWDGHVVKIENRGEAPLLAEGIFWEDQEHLINVVIDGGETIEVYPEGRWDQGRLQVQIIRELDMVVPRRRCTVRHGAEKYEPGTLSQAVFDIIFDIGIGLSQDKRIEAREARLRSGLTRNSSDAVAAVNLASLLIQKQEYAEAEKWLRLALSLEESLPDFGRRARMQMREIQRRCSAAGLERNGVHP